MAKLNIFQDEWCDILFEERNQSYGAFVLRKQSGKRHIMAILVTIILFTLGVAAPTIIKKVMPKQKITNVEVTELSKIDLSKQKKTDEVKKVVVEEIQQVKAAIKFVPPVIKPDEEVTEQDTIRTMDQLNDSRSVISTIDQAGVTDDPNAVNPDVVQILEDTAKTVYTYVEQMPDFPGGQDELMKYLQKNIKYPEIAQENGISGRVFVQFVVSSNGSISNVQVMRGVDPSLDKEAVRVIRNMPSWKPGKQNGTPVKVQMSVPVNFRLE
jgi:periplasmic protein TonB